METAEIARKLVAYCRNGEWSAAQNELYAEDAISIEPFETPEFEKETKGLKAIIEKGEKFDSIIRQVHSIEVSEPLIVGNAVAFTMEMDVTTVDKGRMKTPELCIYEVANGKIVSEQFFV